MNTLADRLRIARERLDISQIDVSKKIGISNKTISGYENGVSEPDIDTLRLLAQLYQVSIDWLAGVKWPDDGRKRSIEYDFMASLREKVGEGLFEEYVKASDDRKQDLLKGMQTIYDLWTRK